MPHKRNPAGCLLALEAARVPGLAATLLGELAPEHERGLGQWQSQLFTLRELARAGASALAAMSEVLRGLEVNPKAMAANLERTNGLVFSEALALRVSRPVADLLCERALREGRHLLEVARADADVKKQLETLFEPQNKVGAARRSSVLAQWLLRASKALPECLAFIRARPVNVAAPDPGLLRVAERRAGLRTTCSTTNDCRRTARSASAPRSPFSAEETGIPRTTASPVLRPHPPGCSRRHRTAPSSRHRSSGSRWGRR
jgi:hypothetical protein